MELTEEQTIYRGMEKVGDIWSVKMTSGTYLFYRVNDEIIVRLYEDGEIIFRAPQEIFEALRQLPGLHEKP